VKVTERWYSHRMHRDVTLARWGHYGVPVLLFPTAGGDAEEVERNQLIAHLEPLIADGRVKVYSCDSVAGQALVRKEGSPEHRMWLFNQFHDTVAHEIVPAIVADCGGPQPIVAAGSSIGAFNSLAMICRYPHLFNAAVCMSGTYRLDALIGGPVTEDLYYASPLHFLPGLEGPLLEELQRRFIVLATGTGDWEDIGESWAVAHVLGSKQVPNRVDDWGPSYPHDWHTWWQMLPVYLDELVP
jgi:esterase/lipase superfamily enzyme